MTNVRIVITTKMVKAGELMPGDLFSTADSEYWSNVNLAGETGISSVGEKVYIRTNTPISEEEKDTDVTLVDLSYEREDGNRFQSKSHQAYHIDVAWDEEGNRIAELAPNPNCPYCRGEDTEFEIPWDGKGAHPYLDQEGICRTCRETDKVGDHKLQPTQEKTDRDEGEATDATINRG